MTAKIILMRHGRSAWNQKNLFTGWVDVPLDEKGVEESIKGGKKIEDIPIDVCFTSTLIRAQMTLALALLQHKSGKVPVFLHSEAGKVEEWSQIYSDETKREILPVHSAWELNERMYGKLQGLNKAETAKKFGETQVQIWRRSFDKAPPDGESLEMTAKRTLPYFHKTIVPHLAQGKNVYVSAHGNSLRSIVMDLDRLTPDQVVKLEIATGEPLIYSYSHGVWTRL